ncbi:hypothetical protein Vretifemale_6682 [Volvox reticuliferus]|uniref:Uncharacterized protein n=1 Tax=Volvox reticuliferus TaxID=1737510 RepID=A0A8J4FLI9_9CHLO|nr:hypothetical protein Vretifemale_6682 [Volvox reticuliferus]
MLPKSSCHISLPSRKCSRIITMVGTSARGYRLQRCRANPEELRPVPIIREEGVTFKDEACPFVRYLNGRAHVMVGFSGQVDSLLRSSREETAEEDDGNSALKKFLYPDPEELPTQESLSMPLWDHLEELRERVLVAGLACAAAILTCFIFSKDLVVFLEAPVADAGVRFLQLSPGEFFFTTLKASRGPMGWACR